MKSYKFLLFAFVLLLFATPLFASFEMDDYLPDKEHSTQVVFAVGQKVQYSYYNDRSEPQIYNDAVDLSSQHHLTHPTKATTVKDLSRNINPFRFSNQSNRKFIANSFYAYSKGKA